MGSATETFVVMFLPCPRKFSNVPFLNMFFIPTFWRMLYIEINCILINISYLMMTNTSSNSYSWLENAHSLSIANHQLCHDKYKFPCRFLWYYSALNKNHNLNASLWPDKTDLINGSFIEYFRKIIRSTPICVSIRFLAICSTRFNIHCNRCRSLNCFK